MLFQLGKYSDFFTYFQNRLSVKDMDWKESFDRFGDDLTQEIIQYLTFDDKIRLECMSKQWRRLVFNKQFDLRIECKVKDFEVVRVDYHNCLNRLVYRYGPSDYLRLRYRRAHERLYMNETYLVSVLKKCQNIKRIRLRIDSDSTELDLFFQYLPKLKHVYCEDMHFIEIRPTLTQKAFNYGLKLESVQLDYCAFNMNSQFDLFLRFCPEVKTLSLFSYALFNAMIENQSLNKLKTITSLDIKCEDVVKFEILVDKYCHSLEGLHILIRAYGVDYIHLIGDIIGHISRLKKLKSLWLWIHHSTGIEHVIPAIDNRLEQMTRSLSKLKKLSLTTTRISQNDKTFLSLSNLKSLERLDLRFYDDFAVYCQCSTVLTELKYLNIFSRQLNEDFLFNIGSVFPNLRILVVDFGKGEFDFSIMGRNYFRMMSSLQKITINSRNGYKKFYFNESLRKQQ